MSAPISPTALNRLMRSDAQIGLLDVREYGEYNVAHIPGFSSLPRRLLEFRARDLVPFEGTHLVVCDDDGRRAVLASATLEKMGYSRVSVLEGGANRWAHEGFPTEWGMNVPSKDFGERVRMRGNVPEIGAEELHERMEKGKVEIVLDARTPEEHQHSCIPGSRSVPGGELSLRIWDVVVGPDTPVVVHCAGRTRSIIGTSLLQRMGFKKACGLRNGTMGWAMAGLDLETGSDRLALPEASEKSLSRAGAFAQRVAAEDGVRLLGPEALQEIIALGDCENVYLIDVRTREEYIRGHIPGFRWYPGGQAVQQSDDLVAVRTGKQVFCCDSRVRAFTTASWFKQMGFPNVYAVDGGSSAWTKAGLSLETGMSGPGIFGLTEASAQLEMLDPMALHSRLGATDPPVVLFVGTSAEFSAGHIPGAGWVPRGSLEIWIEDLSLSKSSEVVLACPDGVNSVLAGATLKEMGYDKASVLDGGMRAWAESGLPVERGLTGVMHPPNDLVRSGTNRNWAEAIHYLAWERELGRKYDTG